MNATNIPTRSQIISVKREIYKAPGFLNQLWFWKRYKNLYRGNILDRNSVTQTQFRNYYVMDLKRIIN